MKGAARRAARVALLALGVLTGSAGAVEGQVAPIGTLAEALPAPYRDPHRSVQVLGALRGHTARPFVVGHQHLQRAGQGVQPDDVTVTQTGQGATAQRFRRHVDGRGDLAAGATHPTVGHQRHPEAPVLQHRQRRGELVQFRHAVGRRPLEAHHGHHVALELAYLEGR